MHIRSYGVNATTRLVLVVTVALLATGALIATGASAAASKKKGKKAENGWIALFDGKTLNGWKANEDPKMFTVENGTIVAHGARCHLFYEGPVENHNFKNFHFRADVMTTTGANSGIFFHTAFQESGWPGKGYEAQVNSSHTDWRRSGSLWGVNDVKETLTTDGKWFQLEIIVQGNHIALRIDGKTAVEYDEPANVVPPKDRPERKLSSGTFALQSHPPIKDVGTGIVYFKNIAVRPLP